MFPHSHGAGIIGQWRRRRPSAHSFRPFAGNESSQSLAHVVWGEWACSTSTAPQRWGKGCRQAVPRKRGALATHQMASRGMKRILLCTRGWAIPIQEICCNSVLSLQIKWMGVRIWRMKSLWLGMHPQWARRKCLRAVRNGAGMGEESLESRMMQTERSCIS